MQRIAFLLALVPLIPSAAAVGEIVLALEGETEPFTLTEQRAEITVDVDCSIVSGVPPEVRVELSVAEAPYWLTATPGPHILTASPTDCPGSRATLSSLLKMFKHPVDEEPIAGTPSPVVLVARTVDARGTAYEARAEVLVEPALYGEIAVAPRALPDLVEPGEIVEIRHTIRNAWNAPAIVAWTPDADARILGIAEHTTRVPANGEAIASANASIPGDRGTTLRLGLTWTATRDAPEGGALGAGASDLALFVSCTPCVEPPVGAADPAPAAGERTPVPVVALLAAAGIAAALLRRR